MVSTMSVGRRVLIAVFVVLLAIALAGELALWRVLPVSRAPVSMVTYQATGFGPCDQFINYQINVVTLTIDSRDICNNDSRTTRGVDPADMARFTAALEGSHFRHWRTTYANPMVVDGGGFDLHVVYADGKTQDVSSLNLNPPGVGRLHDALAILGID